MSSKVLEEHTAYIALGSNLGDKEANLRRALELLEERGVEVVQVSSFICMRYARCALAWRRWSCCTRYSI